VTVRHLVHFHVLHNIINNHLYCSGSYSVVIESWMHKYLNIWTFDQLVESDNV